MVTRGLQHYFGLNSDLQSPADAGVVSCKQWCRNCDTEQVNWRLSDKWYCMVHVQRIFGLLRPKALNSLNQDMVST